MSILSYVRILVLMNFACLLFVGLAVANKPYSKRRQATWRLECELGIITDSDCPVDGGWSSWAPWSPCHGACDDVGHRRRIRECVNPPASQDGLPCSGSHEEIQPCYLTNCSVEDFRKIVKGDTSRSTALSQLEAVPKLMDKCLSQDCTYEYLTEGLASENTWQIGPEILWNAFQCVKHGLGCQVKGEWGVWSSWSECGSRCGKGLRWRQRRCNTPPPSASHLVCSGTSTQFEECEGDQCAIDKRFVERDTGGTWSEWSSWSECSEKCGTGTRERKRRCIEKQTLPAAIPWGTHCQGQYYQLEECNNKKCVLNGGWSGWSPWGPCSQTCGAGMRSRTRSCTRPVPSGGGVACSGPKREVGSCYLKPCYVYSHTIVLFNGDSYMQYNFTRKRSTFFHFYIRFMPLSPHGTLVRRGELQNPQIRLSLHKWHACLDASGASKPCSLPRVCSPTALDPAIWHSLLLTVTNEAATMRIDDALSPIRVKFPCDPELISDPVNIVVGEKFHGEIQELILNFIPLNIYMENARRSVRSEFVPSSISNIAYNEGNTEEGYLIFENNQYIRIPCFERQDEWEMELIIKSKREQGILLYMEGDTDYRFLVLLQNMRLKMKVEIGEYKSEVTSSTEYLPNQWLDVSFAKRQASNAIEAIINYGERLHISLSDGPERKRRILQKNKKPHKIFNSNCSIFEVFAKKHDIQNKTNERMVQNAICCNEFFIAGLPIDIRSRLSDETTAFYGVIASLKVNDELLDLHDFTIENEKDGQLQVSSRTASISGLYHEIGWGDSNKLDLTCIYARSKKSVSSKQMAHWLFLDTELSNYFKNNALNLNDDGNILRLLITADNNLRGFYTCRTNYNNQKRNIVTYGVLGKIPYKLNGHDFTTVLAIFTTTSLVVFTIGWLFVEIYYDAVNGYGFYRDIRLSSEEGSDISNKFGASNDSDYTTKDIKLRKKRRKILATKSSFATQNFDGLMDIVKEVTQAQEGSTISEPLTLPALPNINGLDLQVSHEIYRYEPNYVSSPRHGSIITSGAKLTSSSSKENSPRTMCSRLLMTKYRHSSIESLSVKRKVRRASSNDFRNRSNLLTIKSSTFVNSPAQRILQKFKELKSDDA